MIVLGIDPGPKQSAWCRWDGQVVLGSGIVANEEIHEIIIEKVRSHGLASLDGYAVAVEHIQCMGMAVGAEVFETAYQIGEIRYDCRFVGIPFVKVTRTDVKLHLCHSMRARDPHIRQALIDRFGKPGTKRNPGATYGLKSHIWSAFAIAVYAWDKKL